MTRHDDFQLGLFSANTASGLSITTVPERWSGNWEDNLRLALLAERVGIDFMLPVARWTDWGPDTAFHESALETLTWATGLLAATSRLRVFATVHTAFHHPLVVAKQLATIDHISRGRVGLNIVAGWHAPEYSMFGLQLPTEHDDRYALAQEWWEVVRRVWAVDEPFDHKGRFFDLQRVVGRPKPYNGSSVPIINAGSSKQGRAFAARNADHAFTSVGGPEDGAAVVQAIQADARAGGREVGVFTFGHVSCRPTETEARDHLRYYAQDNADWPAVEEVMRMQGLHAQSFTPEMLATFRDRFAAGHGGYPLVGDPDQVAAQITAFADAGFAGMTLSFLDYAAELPYFAQEVLPRLERAGIRAPRSAAG